MNVGVSVRARLNCRQRILAKLVAFVPKLKQRAILRDPEIFQELSVHILGLGFSFGMGDVPDMQDHIRMPHFFEGGPERRNKLGRQVTDKPHSIGQDDRGALWEAPSPRKVGSSVAKSISLAKNVGPGQTVEEC